MTALRQCLVASSITFQSLPQRIWPSSVIVVSMACVVGVLLSMLSQVVGLRHAYETGGAPTRAVVMLAQEGGEYGSGISRSDVGTILSAPGIAMGSNNRLMADAETLFWIPPTRGYSIGSPELRGVGPVGFALRPEFKIDSGRVFRSGTQELIIGKKAARAFGLRIGDKMILPNGEWPIVGVFSAQGGIIEGQLVGDVETVMTTSHIAGFGSILVELENTEAFESFRTWLTTNPTLAVTAERQSDFYVRTANRYAAFFMKIAYAIGIIMALGALFALIKITYATVDNRAREIATLRAIGYRPFPVAVSILIEITALAVVGASLGTGAAWLLFDGKLISNNQNVFDASVTPQLFLLGIGWATVLVVLGGSAPAIRAARLSVVDALKTQ